MDINIDNYLRINLVDMGMVLISTFLIVLIVKRYFWKYVKQYLDARQLHIQTELATTSQNLHQSEELKAQYAEQMKHARSDADSIILDAKQKASREAEAIIIHAEEHAQTVKAKAFQDIEYEKAKVKEQMKEEISEVAFLAAKKVVAKELDEDVHKKYVKDFIDQAGGDSWQA